MKASMVPANPGWTVSAVVGKFVDKVWPVT